MNPKVRREPLAGGGTVYIAEMPGRTVRIVVPEGSEWRHVPTREECICAYAGIQPERGMY